MLTQIRKEIYYRFWLGYQAMIIAVGLVVVGFSAYASIPSLSGSTPIPFFLSLLVLLALYVLADLIPLWLRNIPHSPAFVVLLLALLLTNTAIEERETIAIVTLLVTLGSLIGETGRNLRSSQSTKFKLSRTLFYAAHYAIATSIGTWLYFYVNATWTSPDLLENVPFLAIAACLFVATLLSTALIYPHDWLFDRFLLATPQERFPRFNLLTSILITPVPVFLFSLFAPEDDFVWIVLSALFLVVIYMARTYVQIDVGNRQQKAIDEIEKSLGVPNNMDDLLQKLTDLLDNATGYQWAALYHSPTVNDTYLRGVMQRGEPAISYSPPNIPLSQTIPVHAEPQTEIADSTHEPLFHWPRHLRQNPDSIIQQMGNITVLLEQEQDGEQPDVNDVFYFPPTTPYLCLPIRLKDSTTDPTTGLLLLVRSQRFFRETERRYAQNLAHCLVNKLRHLEQVEGSNDQRWQQLFTDIKSSVETRERVEKSIHHLATLGVDFAKVLGEIANYSLQANLIFSLRGNGTQESALSEETLEVIYKKVQLEHQMPPLTEEIIQHLKVIPDSFALSFSVQTKLQDLKHHETRKDLHDWLAEAAKIQTVDEIITLKKGITHLITNYTKHRQPLDEPVMDHLKGLLGIIKKLEASHAKPEQKQEHLVAAFNQTRELEKTVAVHLVNPEKFAFHVLLLYWLTAIIQTLNAANEGGAELYVSLRQNYALPTPTGVTVVLNVKNRGQGPALNVQVQLQQQTNNQYQLIHDNIPTPHTDILLPGRTQEFAFVIKPSETQNLRLSFVLTYQDREKSRNEKLFADVLHLRPTILRFTEIENPYLAGIPLAENHQSFVGREDVFAFISENMRMSLSQHPVLLLIGSRRIGKTSILKQLPTRLKEQNYVHVFLDCQGLVDSGNASFFLYFAQAIANGLTKAGYPFPPPTIADFQDNSGHVFKYLFLPQVWQLIGNRHLLVVVDEYEVLERRVQDGKLDQEVILSLRSLMQHEQRLAFIFAGTTALQELSSDYWHVFFNIAKMHPIGFLSEADAEALIIQPVYASGMVYDDLAIEEILRGTGRHPYFLQLICDELVSLCNREERNYVTIAHAQTALRTILDRGQPHLNFIWDRATPRQRLVLSALAKSLVADSVTTVDTLMRHLLKAGHDQETRAEVRQALELLEEQLVIVRNEEPGSPPTYDFAATLYFMWIKKHHALD